MSVIVCLNYELLPKAEKQITDTKYFIMILKRDEIDFGAVSVTHTTFVPSLRGIKTLVSSGSSLKGEENKIMTDKT